MGNKVVSVGTLSIWLWMSSQHHFPHQRHGVGGRSSRVTVDVGLRVRYSVWGKGRTFEAYQVFIPSAAHTSRPRWLSTTLHPNHSPLTLKLTATF